MTNNDLARPEWITLHKFNDFDEIPDNPKGSEFWMVDDTIALWFTTKDNRWRFMVLEPDEPARISGESFDTKKAAKEFYQLKKVPTWIRGPIPETCSDGESEEE